MRADRLLSILILLQTSGRMTAHQLAEEMEVSERTIYRDIDALCASGVPIYTECGPGGGFELLESYRTDLIGLDEQEIMALMMLSIPQPLKELGVGQKLRGARLKLSAAMLEMGLQNKQRIHLDSRPWLKSNEHVPFLSLLHQALIEDKLISIKYRGVFDTEIDATAAPYGMVAKTDTWYLIFECYKRMRVIRISNILKASILDDKFDYPQDFYLSLFWDEWCRTTESLRPSYNVTLSVSPDLFKFIQYQHGGIDAYSVSNHVAGDRDGWIRLNLSFESFEDARRNILAYGKAAEVIEPISLRMSVIDFACQIKDLYGVRD